MFETREGEAGHLSQSKLAELTADQAAQGARKLTDILGGIERKLGTPGPSPDDLFGDGAESGSVSVGKRSYNTTKQVAQHTKFRTEVRDEYGRPGHAERFRDAHVFDRKTVPQFGDASEFRQQ